MNTTELLDDERNEYETFEDLFPGIPPLPDGESDPSESFGFIDGGFIVASADMDSGLEFPLRVESSEVRSTASMMRQMQHENEGVEPDLSLHGTSYTFGEDHTWQNEFDQNMFIRDQGLLPDFQDELASTNTIDGDHMPGSQRNAVQRPFLIPQSNADGKTVLPDREEQSSSADLPSQESTAFFGRPPVSRSLTPSKQSPGKRQKDLQHSSSRSSWSIVDRSTPSSNLSVVSLSPGVGKGYSHESSLDINWSEENSSTQADPTLIGIKARKRPYEAEKRVKVQSVREASACIRCQVMKEECSEDTAEGPCSRCQLLAPSYRTWKTPCFRGQLSSAEVFRSASCSLYWPMRSPRKVTTWDGKDQRTVDLFFPKSAENHLAVPKWSIVCRKFRPDPRDLMTKSYPTPQGTVIVQFTPFVLNRMPPPKTILEAYIEPNMEYFLEELTVGTVGELFRGTIEEAKRLSRKSRLLTNALQIAVLSRLSSRSFGISDRETLGMEIHQDPLSPYHGRRPVPPMIDRQLDLTWLTLAEKKRKSVMADLKKLIFKRTRAVWLEVFLTVFILMSNLEFCYRHQWNRLKRHKATSTTPLISFATLSMMEKWESSAENIIAHFAVICNGQIPFHLDWSSGENSLLAGLDDRSSKYMEELGILINSIQWPDFTQYPPELARVQELYWISRIFFPPAHLWGSSN